MFSCAPFSGLLCDMQLVKLLNPALLHSYFNSANATQPTTKVPMQRTTYNKGSSTKFVKRAQTCHTLLSCSDMLFGKICERILKFFTLLITLSTCIRTLAMCLVSCSSFSESWGRPSINGGIFRWSERCLHSSDIVKPLSA